jgi:hypothetical protein
MSDLPSFAKNIPCFARLNILERLHIHVEQPTIVESHLKTEEGFNFKVLIKHERDQTFFGCPGWRGLTKTYECDAGIRIVLEICPRGNNKVVIIIFP